MMLFILIERFCRTVSKTKLHFVLFETSLLASSLMLDQSTIDLLANPISADQPSGPDLAYDPEFIELEALTTPKAEQQFGDSIIPGEEPNWNLVEEKAQAVLLRSKDFRAATFLTRALTQKDGIKGFVQGLNVLSNFTNNFWETLHPQLDADDNNDPTMRANSLAPLWDYEMLLKDLSQAKIGGTGTAQLRVKDVEAHYSKAYTTSDVPTFSIDQVQATLTDLMTADAAAFEALESSLSVVKQFQTDVNDKVSAQSGIDLTPLQTITYALQQAVAAVKGIATSNDQDGANETLLNGSGSSGGIGGIAGPLKTRDDAVRLLSQVITFLEKSEPGNPAPLLIKRAQRLIGMNFIDIINDLAPDALNTVQNIAGRSDES
jgi:type VI secretion system protein ImpA